MLFRSSSDRVQGMGPGAPGPGRVRVDVDGKHVLKWPRRCLSYAQDPVRDASIEGPATLCT